MSVNIEYWRTHLNMRKRDNLFSLSLCLRVQCVLLTVCLVFVSLTSSLLCLQLFFSMYPDRDNPWRMLAVSPTDPFCILRRSITNV